MGSKSNRRAQSLVEFAMVAPLFFLLIFGIIDFGRVYFTQATIQHALREAGRFAVTGNRLPGTNPATGQPYTRVESIIEVARKAAVGADITGITVSSQAGGANHAGGPGDRVTVSITATVRIITPIIGQFFPNGRHTFTARTTFRNEPFNPSQTL
ncbi:MAG: pilus assembly protein [Verrucomicrobiae bacterium]|nr:pilus assembly protein [Verrucomicrobiae bacterium]MDW8343226.1 TadE/TadG family type IV pilus assembly protein [Verrucomicrobiae bacterium]